MKILDKPFGQEPNENPTFTIDLRDEGIFINDVEISLPTSTLKLTELFGEPTQQYHESGLWRIIWDNIGICTDYATSDGILFLTFLKKPENSRKHLPQNIFKGKILINGQSIDNFQEEWIIVNKYQIGKSRFNGDKNNDIYCYVLTQNFDYQEEIPKDKYKIKPNGGKAIVFSDFNFKLLVIEELMYNQELLKPKFDLYEFAEIYDKRKIDIEEEGYAMIPEAVEYFRNLPVSEELAGKVTELYQDGGNDIYGEIFPFWDGEDDTFDIKSYEDVKHFPNLKKMVLFCDDEKTLNELRAKGIEAQTL